MEAETMSDCESPPLLMPIRLEDPVDAVLAELSPPEPNGADKSDKKRKRAARRNCAERIPLDSVIRSLTNPDSGAFPQGISPSQLDDHINSLPENQRVTRSRNHLHVLLWRETKFGHIRRLTTGRYSAPEYADKIETVQTAQVKETKRKVADGAATNPLSQPPPKRQRKRKNNAAATTPPTTAAAENGVASASSSLMTIIDSICQTVAAASQAAKEEIPAADEKKPEAKVARPRRKRTKKSLGPEFVTFESGEDPGVCDYCLLPGNKLRKGTGREVLLKCKDCQAKAHSTCIGYSEELAERSVRSPWQCLDCKTCVVCKTAGDAERMLFCDACDKGYHMDCHSPEVQAKPSGCWICCRCEQEIIGGKQKRKISTTTRLSPTNNNNHHCAVPNGIDAVKTEAVESGAVMGSGEGESAIQPQLSAVANKAVKVDSTAGCSPWVKSHLLKQLLDRKPVDHCEILDALTAEQVALFEQAALKAPHWSVENVVEFVSAVGFSDQSGSFKDQEIDGLSFLLLTRADILSRLSLRVGPALKLYQRVRKLQDLVIENWLN